MGSRTLSCRAAAAVLALCAAACDVPSAPEINEAPTQTAPIGITPGHFAVTAGGAARYSIPIQVPPGRGGMQPKLDLVYTSGHEDGIAGLGFSLQGFSSIARCPRTVAQDGVLAPVANDDNDRFCLDGERLVVVEGEYGRQGTLYRLENNDLSRIESVRGESAPAPSGFRVEAKDGRVLEYGDFSGNGCVDPGDLECTSVSFSRSGAADTWVLSEIRDRFGNAMHFDYEVQSSDSAGPGGLERLGLLPTQIRYASHGPSDLAPSRFVRFEYHAHTRRIGYRAGSLFALPGLLTAIVTGTDEAPEVKRYRLSYDEPSSDRPMLTRLEECAGDGICKPATTFEWQTRESDFGPAIDTDQIFPLSFDATLFEEFCAYTTCIQNYQPASVLDVDDDGADDLVHQTEDNWQVLISESAGGSVADAFDGHVTEFAAWSQWAETAGVGYFGLSSMAVTMDYNQDGVPDLLQPYKGVALLSANGTLAARISLFESTQIEQPGDLPAKAFVHDLNGDGIGDFLHCGLGDGDPTLQGRWRYHLHDGQAFGSIHELDTDTADRINPSGICADSFVRFLDTNGDGATELLIVPNTFPMPTDATFHAVDFTTNPPTVRDSTLRLKGSYHEGSFDQWNHKEQDVNGDGLQDVLMARCDSDWEARERGELAWVTSQVRVWINTGEGFLGGEDGLPAIEGDQGQYSCLIGSAVPFDFDGDGRLDILVAKMAGNQPGGPGTWEVLRATGEVSDLDGGSPASRAYRDVGWPSYNYASAPLRNQTFADLNGDQVPDLVTIDQVGDSNFGRFVVREGRGKAFNGVVKIREGLSGVRSEAGDNEHTWTHHIEYAPLSDEDLYQRELPFKWRRADCDYPTYCDRPAMQVVRQHTMATTAESPEKRDSGHRVYSYRYHDARSDRLGRGWLGFGAQSVTEHDIAATVRKFDNSTYLDSLRSYPFVGRLERSLTEYELESGIRHVVDVRHTLDLLNAGGTYIPFVRETQRWVQEGSTIVDFESTRVDSIDAFGNVTQRTRKLGLPSARADIVITQYLNDEERWLLGLATRREETSTVGSDAATRISTSAYDAATGALVATTVEPGQADLELTTRTSYDSYGNAVRVERESSDGEVRATEFVFDQTEHQFLDEVTNALGHTTRSRYDRQFGLVVETSDPNGLVATWTYDGFGRELSRVLPDGSRIFTLRERSEIDAEHFETAVHRHTPGGQKSTTLFDRRQLPYRVISEGPHGIRSFSGTTYTPEGRIRSISRPTLLGVDPEGETRFAYDRLGRPLLRRKPGGETTHWTHEGRKTVQTDPRGNATQLWRNGFGEVDRIVDANGGDMRYLYTAFGYIEEIRHEVQTRPQLRTRLIHDAYGRLQFRHDPDSGFTQYRYNSFGETTTKTDANDHVSTFEYDALGRLTKRTDADGVTTRRYDEAEHGVGSLHQTASVDAVIRTLTYTDRGQPATLTLELEGESYVSTSDYDEHGRIVLTTLETESGGMLSLERVYDDHGHLVAIRDRDTGRSYWEAKGSDAESNITREDLGNGVQTFRKYDPTTGRLTSIESESDKAQIQHLEYAYDANGNLEKRTDRQTEVGQVFRYDELNRLTDARTCAWTGATGCTTTTYRYDRIGNLTHRSDVGDYFYAARPAHGVILAGGQSYEYDDVGNQTSRPGATLDYTPRGMPRAIETAAQVTRLLYDADDRRVARRSKEGDSTAYFNGLYQHQKSATGEQHRFFVMAGDRVVATVLRGEREGVVYSHHDHLGSVDALTDEEGALLSHLRFAPFGNYLGSSWLGEPMVLGQAENVFGFTGHEHEPDSSLVNMGGRLYDPSNGRFLSPDPLVQAPHFLQSHNRYSYVFNNPLAFTDPSGLQAVGESDVGITEEDPVLVDYTSMENRSGSSRLQNEGTAAGVNDSNTLWRATYQQYDDYGVWDRQYKDGHTEREFLFVDETGEIERYVIPFFEGDPCFTDPGLCAGTSVVNLSRMFANRQKEPAVFAEPRDREFTHVDMGGEGRHLGAINLGWQPQVTDGYHDLASGDRIPNLVLGNVENQPLADNMADLITLEGTPIRKNTPREIARIIKPGGLIILASPEGAYSRGQHKRVIDEVGGRVTIDRRVQSLEGYRHSDILVTVIVSPE